MMPLNQTTLKLKFMKTNTLLHRVWLFACLTLLVNTLPVQAQEKLKIDNETVAVVPSPWKLASVETKASLRGPPCVFGKRNLG